MKFHSSLSPREKADQFLKVASQFQLGELATESSHPKTRNLSSLAQNNLHQAVELLREVDLDALEMLVPKLGPIEVMGAKVWETFHRGGRVFLCGCGATGRFHEQARRGRSAHRGSRA